KVDSEIPTPVPGTIVELLSAEGDTIEVGLPIAIIETEAAGVAAPPAEKKEEESVADKKRSAEPPAAPAVKSTAPKSTGDRFYSPVVMNIAAENGVSMEELETITGSGINGRVTKKDILAYLKTRGTAPARQPAILSFKAGEVEVIPLDNMRRKIAEHMIHSKQTSAHVSLYTEVDMHNIFRIRQRNKTVFKKQQGFNLTYMPFIVEATVKALKEYPLLNAQMNEDNILLKHFYNIGIAVAVKNGLIVPNIFNAEEKSLVGLARAIHDLAVRARDKKLQPDELANGTFSISNFGVYGTTIGFPIINQPQVAILGVGAVKKRPLVIDDAIAIRPVMYLALTIDHRIIDGAMGSQFLECVRDFLEQYDPEMDI
ncbi:MAG TPA: 2-oxo acid dehydrogenase subunit E2, partial [Calditrichaeota bacterium]|nr:2-oxo acid dehydrogenase subunit E2 [Calditrichota bacterium]